MVNVNRLYAQNIAVVANEVGRKPPTFLDASKVANELIQLDFNSGKIVYNRFKYFIIKLPLLLMSIKNCIFNCKSFV